MSTRFFTAIGLVWFGLALSAVPLGTPAQAQSPPPAGATFRANFPGPSYVLHTPAGRIERITVHGASLVGNLEGDSPDREVLVYLPPSYAKDPNRRYPVLYVGKRSSPTIW